MHTDPSCGEGLRLFVGVHVDMLKGDGGAEGVVVLGDAVEDGGVD